MCLAERLVRLDRHRLAQELMPLLAALEAAAREGDLDAVARLARRVRELLRVC